VFSYLNICGVRHKAQDILCTFYVYKDAGEKKNLRVKIPDQGAKVSEYPAIENKPLTGFCRV
jgi:hypothetical protein